MAAYIIGFIIVVIVMITIGLILRKRIYDRVDKLEAWKMDIMNRNVSAELQRIKTLRLSGETQEKFESWKSTWDRILTRDLPDIEEFLFDAEEAADRFRMPSAKKNLAQVEATLNSSEQTIKDMFAELEELLDSEKQSRKELDTVIPQIKELRHLLLEGSHLFDKAVKRFEQEIQAQQEELDLFYQESDEGNYYEARKIVDRVKEAIKDLAIRMEAFPVIYKKVKKELPDKINELRNGIIEMKTAGFHINDQDFLRELDNFNEQVTGYVAKLEREDDQSIYEFVEIVEERIQEVYNVLEREAKAKAYVEKHIDRLADQLLAEVKEFQKTDAEVTELQKTYYLEGSDLELYDNLKKWIHQLERHSEDIISNLEEGKQTYVGLKDQLESSFQDIEKLQESHHEFKDQVRTIRKDELVAKEQIQVLQQQLQETNRQLKKSNLPGVPSFVWNQLDEATVNSGKVNEKLNEQPLDMGQVNHALEQATSSVEALLAQTEQMIEQAYLVERVIQYGNRYRSQYPVLAGKLLEAEKLFRDYHYEQALELAAETLEEVEPGALSKLELRIKVPS
ncbi:septation ring formation regulator [Amphibacillus marinus]|uniref:Septation ring formation regulator EzrA n=1 Tax=Amphibacillus marinus TaxID=872970 RepID=A0A1H8T155_9BACI|nr:septation ring formation regulator EzrA [Amphibacillus marinus]SEO84710.1 septation ring formation regulator [Amphibacillus marinus]